MLESSILPCTIAYGLTPQESNIAAIPFSTEPEVELAPDPLVLDAEVKLLQRHDLVVELQASAVVEDRVDPVPQRRLKLLHKPYCTQFPPLLRTLLKTLLKYFLTVLSQDGTFSPPKSRLLILGGYFTAGVTHILGSARPPSPAAVTFAVVSGLAASLGYGAASEFLRRSTTSTTNSTDLSSSLMMTEANLTRFVSKLTRMRGAALEVGQFRSIQGMPTPSLLGLEKPDLGFADTHVLPPELDRVVRCLQDSAH